VAAPRRAGPGGAGPLTPRRKWQTITVATLVLVPAFWAMLAGFVSAAADDAEEAPNAGAALAVGVAVVPFVFVVLAFMSQHPRAPMAVVKAMGTSLAVGVPVALLAGDPVSGIVAGVGAGGIVALRPEPGHGWRPRALGVLVAAAYTSVLVRTVPELALLTAPVFPLTAIGFADQLVDRRVERDRAREMAAN